MKSTFTTVKPRQSAEAARSVLQDITANPRHEFWPENASYHDIPITGIISQRQVTDAYLAHLARSYSSRVATFDQALAKLHADVADLISSSWRGGNLPRFATDTTDDGKPDEAHVAA